MGIYTKTVTTTYANLKFALQGLTADSNIIVSDPQNAIIGNVSTAGTLGYIINNNGSKKVDFSDTDFSSASLATDTTNAFYNCTRLVAMGKLPTTITNATNMFYLDTALVSANTAWVINVTNATQMFQSTALTNVDTNYFTKLITGDYMFAGCSGISSISTAAFKNVQSAHGMFGSMTLLSSIDISKMNKLKTVDAMFYGDTALLKILALDNVLSLSAEPTSDNTFLKETSSSLSFIVTPTSYSTWVGRLTTNYAKWGLSAALAPKQATLLIYHRIA